MDISINDSATAQNLIKRQAELSRQSFQKMQEEELLNSSTLNEIMNDKYDYKGPKSDTVYIINRKTKEPEEATISVKPSYNCEDYYMYDKAGRLIGRKNVNLEYNFGEYIMHHGTMRSYGDTYAGVGTRLDQLQIERARELKIDKIPRISVPAAVLYHIKEGFTPKTTRCKELESLQDLNEIKTEFIKNSELKFYGGSFWDCIPIIIEKSGKLFADLNTTITYINAVIAKMALRRFKTFRIDDKNPCKFYDKQVNLQLCGKNLEKWYEMIKGHEILPKIKF